MQSSDSSVSSAKMIYLDVSSTAVSPMITGIPRVVRALAEQRNKTEVHLVEFDGLANNYKILKDFLPSNIEVSESTSSRLTIVATKLYKVLLENVVTRNIVTTLLRNRFIFYIARRLFGVPSSRGEILKNPDGILFLPEVPLHLGHVKKILRLKKSQSMKLVLFLHDLLPLKFPEYFSHDLVWKFKNYIQLIEKADLILVSNEDVKREVENEFNTNCVQVINLPSTYSGISVPLKPLSRFLVVGTIEPRKNYLTILKAFEKLHTLNTGVELRIVGNVGWQYTDIVAQINALKNQGLPIHWTMNLNDEELCFEYQNALALVYPSFQEGYGLPVIEALSQCTPVITSDRPAMRLFKRFGGVTLIDPNSVEELFQAMKQMLDSDYRESQSQAIKTTELPTGWSDFTEKCYKAVKEV